MIELLQTFMNAVSASASPPSSTASSAVDNVADHSWSLSKSSLWPIRSSSTEQKTRTSLDEDQYESLPQYTLAEVSEHWQLDDCWMVVEDLVYNVTEFIDEHPGGQYIVMEHAGRDATLVFRGSRHSQDAYNMLDKYLVGVLVENERMYLTTTTTTSTASMNSSRLQLSSSPPPSKGL